MSATWIIPTGARRPPAPPEPLPGSIGKPTGMAGGPAIASGRPGPMAFS